MNSSGISPNPGHTPQTEELLIDIEAFDREHEAKEKQIRLEQNFQHQAKKQSILRAFNTQSALPPQQSAHELANLSPEEIATLSNRQVKQELRPMSSEPEQQSLEDIVFRKPTPSEKGETPNVSMFFSPIKKDSSSS